MSRYLFLVFTALLLVSCSKKMDNPVSPDQTDKNGLGKVSFSMSIPVKQIKAQYGFSIDSVTVRLQGSTNISGKLTLSSDTTTATGTFSSLATGNYLISVAMFSGGDTIATGSGTATVLPGQQAVANITLSFLGSLIINVTLPTNSTPGLVAYYPFNGDANDASGAGKNGTLLGTYSFVDGLQGQSVQLIGDNTTFHSTGGYVQIPPIDTSNLQGLTISIWVKEDSSSGGDGYVFMSSDYTQGWCGIGHFGTYVQYAAGANNTTVAPLSIPFDSTAFGSWTMYTLVYSNNILSAYINGQLKGSVSQKLSIYGSLVTIGSHIWGGEWAGYSTHFTGDIDEARIYNRALSVNELQTLYQSKQ